MQSRARALVVLGVVAAALALFLVLKGNDNSSSTSTTATPLVIHIDKDGKPVGGIADMTVNKGGTIHFTVDSAVADEVHLHGYDIPMDVKAGGS